MALFLWYINRQQEALFICGSSDDHYYWTSFPSIITSNPTIQLWRSFSTEDMTVTVKHFQFIFLHSRNLWLHLMLLPPQIFANDLRFLSRSLIKSRTGKRAFGDICIDLVSLRRLAIHSNLQEWLHKLFQRCHGWKVWVATLYMTTFQKLKCTKQLFWWQSY